MRNYPLLVLLALSASATAAPETDMPARAASACNGEGLASFVGQPATQALGAEMLRVSGARAIRWVAHGMMVTMDFSPERLTVYLTPDSRVERASCG